MESGRQRHAAAARGRLFARAPGLEGADRQKGWSLPFLLPFLHLLFRVAVALLLLRVLSGFGHRFLPGPAEEAEHFSDQVFLLVDA